MEESLRQRIRHILQIKDSNPTRLSRETGFNQRTLNNQINSDTQISASTILLILSYFSDISAEWLLRGEGKIYLSKSIQDLDNTIDNDHPVSAETFNQLANSFAALAKQLENVVSENIILRKELDKYNKKDDVKYA